MATIQDIQKVIHDQIKASQEHTRDALTLDLIRLLKCAQEGQVIDDKKLATLKNSIQAGKEKFLKQIKAYEDLIEQIEELI